MKKLVVTLTSAQFTNLAAVPHLLALAPGAGSCFFPMQLWVEIFNSTFPYLAGSNLSVYIGPVVNGNWVIEQDPSFLQGLTNLISLGMMPAGFESQVDTTQANNQPLYLGVQGADFAAGDGDVRVTLFYAVVALA